MSICGCSYNLNLRERNSIIEVGMQRIAFFESYEDFKKFIEFPYKNVTIKGDISEFKDLDSFEDTEIPQWAQFFAIESLR